MQSQEDQKNHPLYPRCEPSKAEACAWVFSNPTTFEKYYFKFPPLQKHEVQIRVLSTGVCMSDSLYGRGLWGQVQYPIAPGHEVIGVIVKIGEEVTKLKIQDKVMLGPFRNSCLKCEFCQEGKTNVCTKFGDDEKKLYGKYWGGFATHVQTAYSHVFPLPDKVDYLTMAPIMCAGITTFLPLKIHAKPGNRVAVFGCGGLGHLAVQWAVKMDCIVDVFTSSHEKEEIIKDLGGNDIIIWPEADFSQMENKYNVIVNTLPCDLTKEQTENFFKILKPYGKWLQVGVPSSKFQFQIPTRILVKKMITIFGSYVGGKIDYLDMFEFMENNRVKCISEIYSWEEFPQALEKLEKGSPRFRCVVNVAEESIKYESKQLFSIDHVFSQFSFFLQIFICSIVVLQYLECRNEIFFWVKICS